MGRGGDGLRGEASGRGACISMHEVSYVVVSIEYSSVLTLVRPVVGRPKVCCCACLTDNVVPTCDACCADPSRSLVKLNVVLAVACWDLRHETTSQGDKALEAAHELMSFMHEMSLATGV